MKKLILFIVSIVLCSNPAVAGNEPKLLAFECRKEFNIGLPILDGIKITSGSMDGGVIINHVLKTGATRDGYPTSNFTGYRSAVDKDLGFVLVWFRDAKRFDGLCRYYNINIDIKKPIPKPGEWSDYNNIGVLSEALIGDILVSSNKYENQPERCRVKLSY